MVFGGLVELPRHGRQLGLVVQRLIGDREKRTVGHAVAVAVRGDRSRFHLHAHHRRPREEALDLVGGPVLPVAVVCGHHRARPHLRSDPHELYIRRADADLERLLDLGERGHGGIRRDVAVQHAVLAKVRVRQDEVADIHPRVEPGTMPDHHPAVRPQHGHAVGDRLRVRRADTDVDQRDPMPGDRRSAGGVRVGGEKVPRGHLCIRARGLELLRPLVIELGQTEPESVRSGNPRVGRSRRGVDAARTRELERVFDE